MKKWSSASIEELSVSSTECTGFYFGGGFIHYPWGGGCNGGHHGRDPKPNHPGCTEPPVVIVTPPPTDKTDFEEANWS